MDSRWRPGTSEADLAWDRRFAVAIDALRITCPMGSRSLQSERHAGRCVQIPLRLRQLPERQVYARGAVMDYPIDH